MLTKQMGAAEELSSSPPQNLNLMDRECSAAETWISPELYFRTLKVTQTHLNEPEHWRIHDLVQEQGTTRDSDISSTSDIFNATKSESPINDSIFQPSISEFREFLYDQGGDRLFRDSIIWAPPMKRNTVDLLKSRFFSDRSISEDSTDSETKRTISQHMNVNATGYDQVTTGLICRRISDPDYDQKPSHWMDIYFDFGFGAENRVHMKIRRDIPMRYCAMVLAKQLGMCTIDAEEAIHFFAPCETKEMDPFKTPEELKLCNCVNIVTKA
ncbi:unnamed protein product [Calicophoron daubneyi]|uniref:Uncharacterized protein n=1 Tax=Calicophoron daubneyi TaxID=300641 RepID=A0AAV2SZ75_CALDB